MSSARVHLLVSFGAGLVVSVVGVLLGMGRYTPMIGWDVAAIVFCIWVWTTIWGMDAASTAAHANRENPGRELAFLVLLGAAIASLIAVGVVLLGAGRLHGNVVYLQAGLAVASVFVSWTLVHTVFTLTYAYLYYNDARGSGIDFNQPEPPQYSDFAYLAFTLGMTYQVSDTDIQSKPIRRAALYHALLSFPLGAVIIATMINLVSGLAK